MTTTFTGTRLTAITTSLSVFLATFLTATAAPTSTAADIPGLPSCAALETQMAAFGVLKKGETVSYDELEKRLNSYYDTQLNIVRHESGDPARISRLEQIKRDGMEHVRRNLPLVGPCPHIKGIGAGGIAGAVIGSLAFVAITATIISWLAGALPGTPSPIKNKGKSSSK